VGVVTADGQRPAPAATTWRMYAHDFGGTLLHLGSYEFVQAHMLPEPIVPVEVTVVDRADESGTHWGWLAKTASAPTMIWPSPVQFAICFPYGPECEVKRGCGRIVRLRITAGGGDVSAAATEESRRG
jgi:hypothetical protein